MATTPCRHFLPWTRGILILPMESVRKLWMIRIHMRFGKGDSARNVELSCTIIFIITVSLGIMLVRPVILNGRKSGMTPPKSRWKTGCRLRWRTEELTLPIRDFIMSIIFWQHMRPSGVQG